jgi:hypothetical protein
LYGHPVKRTRRAVAALRIGQLPFDRNIERLDQDIHLAPEGAALLAWPRGRKGSRYNSGRSPYWLKLKNPESAAVRRDSEEEWGARR